MEKVTGTLKPDTIAVLQGGIVGGRSATYEDHDAFGTLGGRARVEAAALLAKQFPQAVVLTTDAVNASAAADVAAPNRPLQSFFPRATLSPVSNFGYFASLSTGFGF